jgi:hypothetical protein
MDQHRAAIANQGVVHRRNITLARFDVGGIGVVPMIKVRVEIKRLEVVEPDRGVRRDTLLLTHDARAPLRIRVHETPGIASGREARNPTCATHRRGRQRIGVHERIDIVD